MTLHIDLYSWRGDRASDGGKWYFVQRQFEGQEAIDYSNQWKDVKGLPYFNGYSLQTALHDDGECDEHKPNDPVWVPSGRTRDEA